jgi:hypothetical protein
VNGGMGGRSEGRWMKECMDEWMDKLTMVSISPVLKKTKQALFKHIIFQINNSKISSFMSSLS